MFLVAQTYMTQILYVIQSCTYLNNVRRIRASVKVNKNGRGPGEDNINSEYISMH
jgi:hypothetical protein